MDRAHPEPTAVGTRGLRDRVVLITGGTRNIGRAMAMAFAAAGARVGVIGVSDQTALEDTVTALCEQCHAGDAPGRDSRPAMAAGILADLCDPYQLADAIDDLAETLGPIDVLVNNAATRPHAELSQIRVADWDRVLALNLRAPFLTAQRVLPGMVERGWGRIVNVSGIHGHAGVTRRPHVSASKSGLAGLTRALAAECAASGVTVNELVLGAVDTPRARQRAYDGTTSLPMQRLGTMDEVAAACLFLASDAASYITGQTLFACGGWNSLRP